MVVYILRSNVTYDRALLHYNTCLLCATSQVIMNNRRLQYEERASESPLDYDNWFDYLRLEESTGDLDRTREVGVETEEKTC